MIWRIVVYSTLVVLLILIKYPPIVIEDFVNEICDIGLYTDSQLKCFKHISKYKYALQNEIPDDLQPNGRYQNCVWTLWLQGEENAPQVVKNCIKSFRTYLKDRRLIVIDENSLEKYIKLPKHIMDKYKSGAITKTYFSDIVRCCLLYKYGGLWLDATVFLTDKFPSKILNQDFFMFSKLWLHKVSKMLITTWLIYSKNPGNPILKDIIKLNSEYWKCENKLACYNLVFMFFAFSVENDPEAGLIFEKMPRIRELASLSANYMSEYNDNLLCELIKYSHFPIHKLSYKDKDLLKIGKIDKQTYENSILHFFSRPDALKELQRRKLAKNYD